MADYLVTIEQHRTWILTVTADTQQDAELGGVEMIQTFPPATMHLTVDAYLMQDENTVDNDSGV